MKTLQDVVNWIVKYQIEQKKAGNDLTGWCLRTTRLALEANGFKIAHAATAIESFRLMKATPSAWGWKQVGHMPDGSLPVPCLVYFNGSSADGHVGILAKDSKGNLQIYSAITYEWSQTWANRLEGCFLPE